LGFNCEGGKEERVDGNMENTNRRMKKAEEEEK
jgi:hypothetical protein